MVDKHILSRRQLLQWSGFSGASLLLGGCATNLFSEQVGQAFEPLNQNLQALLLSQKPVPEFPISAIDRARQTADQHLRYDSANRSASVSLADSGRSRSPDAAKFGRLANHAPHVDGDPSCLC